MGKPRPSRSKIGMPLISRSDCIIWVPIQDEKAGAIAGSRSVAPDAEPVTDDGDGPRRWDKEGWFEGVDPDAVSVETLS